MFNNIVPTPDVIVTVLGNQTIGNPLLLKCEVITVSGINSSVDIVWIKDDIKIKRMNNVPGYPINNTIILYTSFYNITPLQMIDDNTTYHCQAVINTSPLVNNSDNYTLNVIGECNKSHYAGDAAYNSHAVSYLCIICIAAKLICFSFKYSYSAAT